jgi:hypothetical protein
VKVIVADDVEMLDTDSEDISGPSCTAGVALTLALLVPVPTEFVALTRKSYAVALTRPVTVATVEVDVPSLKVVQVDVADAL